MRGVIKTRKRDMQSSQAPLGVEKKEEDAATIQNNKLPWYEQGKDELTLKQRSVLEKVAKKRKGGANSKRKKGKTQKEEEKRGDT